MNFAQDETILLRRFQDTFIPAYPNVPVDYVGQSNEPIDHRLAKFRVRRAVSKQSALVHGEGQYKKRPMRNFGSILIVLTVPTNDGPGEILEMADHISKSFVAFREGGMLCRPASLTGPAERGAFLEATVDVPFTSDYHA